MVGCDAAGGNEAWTNLGQFDSGIYGSRKDSTLRWFKFNVNF